MAWGTDLSLRAEPDDYLHNPDPRRDRKNDLGGSFFTYRGLTNLGCLILLGVVFVTLLCVSKNLERKYIDVHIH